MFLPIGNQLDHNKHSLAAIEVRGYLNSNKSVFSSYVHMYEIVIEKKATVLS